MPNPIRSRVSDKPRLNVPDSRKGVFALRCNRRRHRRMCGGTRRAPEDVSKPPEGGVAFHFPKMCRVYTSFILDPQGQPFHQEAGQGEAFPYREQNNTRPSAGGLLR
jgi:hypothetical protein